MTKSTVVDFVDAGGNVLLALAPGASDAVRALAAECGVEADAKGTVVYDHFSRQAAGGADDATLVASSAWVDSDAILGGSRPEGPVLFRGVAQAVPTASELVRRRAHVGAGGGVHCCAASCWAAAHTPTHNTHNRSLR